MCQLTSLSNIFGAEDFMISKCISSRHAEAQNIFGKISQRHLGKPLIATAYLRLSATMAFASCPIPAISTCCHPFLNARMLAGLPMAQTWIFFLQTFPGTSMQNLLYSLHSWAWPACHGILRAASRRFGKNTWSWTLVRPTFCNAACTVIALFINYGRR